MNLDIKKIVLACGLGAMVSLSGLSVAMAQPACEQGKTCELKAEVKQQSLKAVNTSTKKAESKAQVKTEKVSADVKKTAAVKKTAEAKKTAAVKKTVEAKKTAAVKTTAQKKKLIEETVSKQ